MDGSDGEAAIREVAHQHHYLPHLRDTTVDQEDHLLIHVTHQTMIAIGQDVQQILILSLILLLKRIVVTRCFSIKHQN